jgi:tetratricopeptide (TPR) repeat protein
LDTRLGRLDDAIANAREVKAMAAAAGAHLFEESVTSILAEALLRNGNAAAAHEAAMEALKTTQGSNSKNRVPAIFAIARCEAAQDDLRSAIAHMLEGLDLLDEANLRIYAADATATLAHFYLQAGMLREALAATRSFVAVLESDLARFEEPDALHWIAANVYLAQGDATKFRSHADRAWSIYQARLEKIPDVQSREAYAALPFHREIVEDRSGARPGSRR